MPTTARIVHPGVLGFLRKGEISHGTQCNSLGDHHSAGCAVGPYGYLSGSPQSVEGFAHVGHPQQLRIILGIAKPLGAIALIVPGMVNSMSGPMPDSHPLGSLHLLRTISREMAQKPSLRWYFC